MEYWRMIPGHPDYEISDQGNCRWVTGTRLKPSPRRKYLAYKLRIGPRKWQRFLAHRLVLLTFVGPCPEGYETRHLNGNRYDNRLKNLYWGTHQENMEDSVRLDAILKGSQHGMAKLTEKQVRAIRATPRPFAKAMREAMTKKYGIAVVTLYRIANGEAWKHL